MEGSAPVRAYGQPAPDHSADAESQAGLYAFGILDGAELVRFERHLAVCGRCAEIVDGDAALVSALSLTAPEAEAEPGFKERLLARAEAELESTPGPDRSGDDLGRAGGANMSPFRPAARRTSQRHLAWLAPLAAVILALLVGAGLLSQQIWSVQVVASRPLENRADGGQAEVLVRRSGEGVIQLTGFADLEDGRVYQAWVIRPNTPPLATGASTSGNGTLTLEGDVRGARVAVTLEPGPGATVPSTRPFLVGDAPA